MLNRLLKSLIVVGVIIITVLAYQKIYYFIITYHIIIYIVLVFLPLTNLAKKSLTVPFLVFIQFFWAALSLIILSLLPLYQLLVSAKYIAFVLTNLLVY